MTLFGITLAFAILLAALGAAMIIHSIVGKRRIVTDFRRLSERIGGRVSRANALLVPRVDGRCDGRNASSLSISPREGPVSSIIVYTLSVKALTAVFLSKLQVLQTAEQSQAFARGATWSPRRWPVRGARARPNGQSRLFAGRPARHLDALDTFPSLVFGPDLLVAGKPFEAPADTDPDAALKHFRALGKIAAEMEAAA
jgi:hypothetical protein